MRVKLLAIMMIALGLSAAPQVASALKFTPAAGSPLTLGSEPVNMSVAGDFNGDGRDDIAAVTNANALHVWLGQVNETFTTSPGSPYAENSLLGAPRTIMAGEFNGDAYIDLAIGYSTAFDVYFGAGNGQFADSGNTHFQVPTTTPSARATADDFSNTLGDVDDDGDLDIVFGMAETGLAVMLNNGAGTFTIAPGGLTYFFPLAQRADFGRSYSPVLGDWDGDEDLDVAVAMGSTGGAPVGVYVADGNGDGTFTPDGQPPLLAFNLTSLVTLNLNDDAYDDLAAGKFTVDTSKNVFTLIGGAAGLVDNPAAGGSIYAGSWPFRIAAVDLDNRQRPDLAVGIPSGSEIAGLSNPGDGTLSIFPGSPFDIPQLNGSSFAPDAVYSGDFNGDGAPDLAADSPYNNSGQAKGIGILINQPDTTGPLSVDFGDVIPPASPSESVMFNNNGAAPSISSSSPKITGTDSTQFSLGATSCGAQINGNGSCTQVVNFVPTSLGDKTANLVFEMSNQDDVVVPLAGKSAVPELTLPNGLQHFDDTLTGETTSRTFTLESTGSTSVVLGNASVVSHPSTGSGDFSITGGSCTSGPLPAGGICEMEISFTPTATGTRSATISVPSSDPAGDGTRTFAVDGAGVDRGITITPTNQEFGDVVLADPPSSRPTRTLTITSSGSSPVTVSDLTIDGIDDRDFAIVDPPSCGTLAPAAKCEVRVSFNPTGGESRARTATLIVESNARGGDKTTELKGRVVDHLDPPPAPRLALALKAPGKVKAGKTLVLKATVKNSGGEAAQMLILKTTVPKKLATIPKAITVPSLAAGQSTTKKIKVKVKKSAKKGKRLAVKLIATAPGAVKVSTKRTVKVR